jgi:(E)-4-hydroxy-3-methylbut-2-enyl-diphosphate synthase
MKRRKAKVVTIGSVAIGGTHPIAVQSMIKAPTTDANAVIRQIKALEEANCQIIRLAVPNREAAENLKRIRKATRIPLVADIHFDYTLALKALDAGVDKLRINPGNIGEAWKIKEVVTAARSHKVPIRIGINAASLELDILSKYHYPTARAMVQSALRHIRLLEKYNFTDIVISLKANDVERTVEAYALLAGKVMYPFHLGITEAGTSFAGSIKSAIGIGHLLYEGIGDTIRVSLSADPVEEVRVGYEILRALGLRNVEPVIIACPACGRAEIDIQKIAREVEEKLKNIKKPLKIAIMGCVVNGPGEAREADLGITGGKGVGLIFKKGKLVKRVAENKLVDELMYEIHTMID